MMARTMFRSVVAALLLACPLGCAAILGDYEVETSDSSTADGGAGGDSPDPSECYSYDFDACIDCIDALFPTGSARNDELFRQHCYCNNECLDDCVPQCNGEPLDTICNTCVQSLIYTDDCPTALSDTCRSDTSCTAWLDAALDCRRPD